MTTASLRMKNAKSKHTATTEILIQKCSSYTNSTKATEKEKSWR